VIRSPFGHVLVGIRENENRMRALGYDVFRYKLAAFTFAGIPGAIAGMLHSQFNIFVSPDAFYWTTSGTVLIMVIIGGAGTLLGPVLGASLVLLLRNLLSSYTHREAMVTGAVFIFFVLFLPGGIIRIPTTLRQRWSSLRGPSAAEGIPGVSEQDSDEQEALRDEVTLGGRIPQDPEPEPSGERS
jgi:branched-chain amino acid transport system permease protein